MFRSTVLWSLVVAPCGFTGCSNISEESVRAAREQLQQERTETERVRQEVAEEVHESLQRVHQTDLSPSPTEDVADALGEAERAVRDGVQAIEEEERETRQAENALAERRVELAAKKVRDQFIASAEKTVEEAENRIETLDATSSQQTGPEKNETQKQAYELRTRLDRLRDQLGDLKRVTVTEWRSERGQVQRALDDLEGELRESR